MMTRKAKRFPINTFRYKYAVSRTPLNSSLVSGQMQPVSLFHGGYRSKTGRPVGVIFMKSGMTSMGRGTSQRFNHPQEMDPENALKDAPSLLADYKD